MRARPSPRLQGRARRETRCAHASTQVSGTAACSSTARQACKLYEIFTGCGDHSATAWSRGARAPWHVGQPRRRRDPSRGLSTRQPRRRREPWPGLGTAAPCRPQATLNGGVAAPLRRRRPCVLTTPPRSAGLPVRILPRTSFARVKIRKFKKIGRLCGALISSTWCDGRGREQSEKACELKQKKDSASRRRGPAPES